MHAARSEQRARVASAEGLELADLADDIQSQLAESRLGVNRNFRHALLGAHIRGRIFAESRSKRVDLVFFHLETRRRRMPAVRH